MPWWLQEKDRAARWACIYTSVLFCSRFQGTLPHVINVGCLLIAQKANAIFMPRGKFGLDLINATGPSCELWVYVSCHSGYLPQLPLGEFRSQIISKEKSLNPWICYILRLWLFGTWTEKGCLFVFHWSDSWRQDWYHILCPQLTKSRCTELQQKHAFCVIYLKNVKNT